MEITDAYMAEQLEGAAAYTVALLYRGPRYDDAAARGLIWEHGRRNFALREEGKLPIVCPGADKSDFAGVAIFAATPEEVQEIMATDPGVEAGVFTYELHPVHGFPDSSLR